MGDPRDAPSREPAKHVPYDIDVEQALLGTFLRDGNSYWRAVEILKADHFYDPLHARIYEAISAMAAGDQNINPLSLHAVMKADAGVITVGGQAYFDNLRFAAPVSPHVRDLCVILRDLAGRRRIIEAAERAIAAAYEPPQDVTSETIAEQLAEDIYEASQGAKVGEGAVKIRELAQEAATAAEDARSMPASVCLTSGLWEVDEHLGGIYRGDLTVLGGAPNMGKTSLAQHILWANASQPDAEEALFFSLEMKGAQVATRELAMRAKVSSDLMRRGKISDAEAERLAFAAHQFPDLPYKIDSTRRLSVAQMRARVKAFKRKSRRGLALVGVDHLRFVQPARPRDSEPEQIQQITSDLKDLAAEEDVALLLISHVNRDFAKRTSARPQLTDLYGSSAIEQNADAVWFIHREIYYLKRNPAPENPPEAHVKWMTACEEWQGKAEIFAAKQRMGPIGSAKVLFEEKFTKFDDIAPPPTQEEIDLWAQMNPR